MTRFLLALILTLLPTSHAFSRTPVQEEPMITPMPVLALYCEKDPGPVNPGGGRGYSMDMLKAEFGCEPAEGIGLTFVVIDEEFDWEHPEASEPEVTAESWYGRCDTDSTGMCQLEAPNSLEQLIGVNLHEGTVKPGYVPAKWLPTTQNITEFAGYGLILVPADPATPVGDDPKDHQTLALLIQEGDEPTSMLTSWTYDDADKEASETGLPLLLATTEGGWVSNVIAPNSTVEIGLINMNQGTQPQVTCGVHGQPDLKVQVDVHDTSMKITIPDTDQDVRCDINLGN